MTYTDGLKAAKTICATRAREWRRKASLAKTRDDRTSFIEAAFEAYECAEEINREIVRAQGRDSIV